VLVISTGSPACWQACKKALARACVAALWHGGRQRTVNVCDDTDLRMGDYFDLAADLCGLPRPPRLSRTEVTDTELEAIAAYLSKAKS
jgi:hypothetical protein